MFTERERVKRKKPATHATGFPANALSRIFYTHPRSISPWKTGEDQVNTTENTPEVKPCATCKTLFPPRTADSIMCDPCINQLILVDLAPPPKPEPPQDEPWLVDDRRWFRKHPNRTFRLRKYVSGELNFPGTGRIIEPKSPRELAVTQAEVDENEHNLESQCPPGHEIYTLVARTKYDEGAAAEGGGARVRGCGYLEKLSRQRIRALKDDDLVGVALSWLGQAFFDHVAARNKK